MTAPFQSALALNNNTPSVFNFNGHSVRIVVIDGEPWFVCTDVAEALGYRNAPDASRHLDADEKDTHILRTLGGDQKLTIINESGLYALVLRSRKPEARRFAKWVTSEVLPQIRKTGSYGTPRIDPAGLLIGDYPELTLPLPPDMQRALDLQAWKLAGEAHALIHEHLRRRVAFSAVVGHPERYLHEGRAREVLAQGDLGDALAHAWIEKMRRLSKSAASLTRESAALAGALNQALA